MSEPVSEETVREARKALVACVESIEMLDGMSMQVPVALRLGDALKQARTVLEKLPGER